MGLNWCSLKPDSHLNKGTGKGRPARRSHAKRGRLNSRAQAAVQVAQVLEGQSMSDLRPDPTGIHDPLSQALVYTTLRHLSLLQATLAQYLDKPIRSRDLDLRCLLLVGIAEITWFATPHHAVLDQTVKASGQMGKTWARGLVNAVLRNHLRAGPPDGSQMQASFPEPSIRCSHPQWLVDALIAGWPNDWAEIVEANNVQAPMTLRVNLSRIRRDDYLHLLAQSKIDARSLPLVKAGVVLDQPLAVADLPGFADGLVSVQDEAAQLAAELLDARDTMAVLDACAAPGGKTAHLLERAPTLSLTAMDIDPQRCQKITQTLDRLGLKAKVVVGDSAAPEGEGESFDRILLDAPCSATGVIRRHPDIKWLRRADDIKRLRGQQDRLLNALWPRLKRGGRMLYATCSLLPEENHSTIAAFNAANSDVRVLPLTLASGVDTGWGHQLLPGQDGTDGFFYALLEKV